MLKLIKAYSVISHVKVKLSFISQIPTNG